ncbi:MAG TPA: hypothetical protein VD978_21685 [Azospirillum sp.]|nr:hypothetical protein [Azospirillum sp.]
MKGKSALIWLGLAGVAGAVLFQTSYEVQGREETLASLNRKIVAEQEAIQVLKAEWSYLNNPSRLETQAAAHLSLRPTDARQFVASAEVIPLRPAPAPEAAPLPPMAGLTPAQPLPSGAYTPAAFKPAPAQPAPAAAEPTAKTAPKVQPAVTKPQPLQPPPRPVATPASVKQAPAAPPKTDTLGIMIARLGGNR